MRQWFAGNKTLFIIISLVFMYVLTYLPLVGRIGYMNDDWYLMYSARAYGPEAFIDITSLP